MPKTSLLMLSGGIDSAYALHKLLRETDDEVIVHHVHLVTDQGRHIPEAKSCQQIVEYCKSSLRSIFYTESTIDHRRFLTPGFDINAVALEAGMVSSSYHMATRQKKTIDRWVIGMSSDDEIVERRWTRAADIARWNCQEGAQPDLFIFPRIDVRDQLRAMPRELFEMTWSCRRPENLTNKPTPCGKCKSCLRRDAAARDVYAAAA